MKRQEQSIQPTQSSEQTTVTSVDWEQLPASPAPSWGFPALSSLPMTELPSDKEYMEIIVTDVSHPPVIYMQLVTEQSLQVISNLETGLNSHSFPPTSASPPPLDHVCCCKYPLDSMWYRASVVAVQEKECTVQFIDYGNKDTVPFSHIVPCPPQFLKVPIMAVQCSLSGVRPPLPSSRWSQQAISFLQQKCYERVLLAKVESLDKNSSVPLVQLIDTSSDNDIYLSTELISAGLAETSLPSTTAAALPELTVAYTPVTHLPGPILPEAEEFDVLVTSVASFTELYIHPVTADTTHNMSTFMASITEYCCSLTTPPATLSIGHYCLALFSDGNWFRAKVESLNSRSGSVDVLFVDFGNRETVLMANIRPMAARFADLPVQVLRCGLSGIGAMEATDPDPAACGLLCEITTSSKMTCRVVCHCPLLVDLIVPATGLSVRAEMATAGKLSPPPRDAVFSVQASSLTLGAVSSVLVTEVQGPGGFWVQSLQSPNLVQLPPLMYKLGKYCNNAQHSTTRTPVLGELCCARFSEDGVWYRARVIAFPSLSECCFCFLDYGNCEVGAVSAILPATPEFLYLPALAIPCTLVGWEDLGEGEEGGGGEGAGVVQKFKSLVENKSLQALQKGWREGRAVVELAGSPQDEPIHKKL